MSVINKSKFIVTVKRRPDLIRAFPHDKGAQAKAYKDKLLNEGHLVEDIARGPLKLLVRIRSRGRPTQYETVHTGLMRLTFSSSTAFNSSSFCPPPTPLTPSAISAAGDITPSTFPRQIKTWEERSLALTRKARGQAA